MPHAIIRCPRDDSGKYLLQIGGYIKTGDYKAVFHLQAASSEMMLREDAFPEVAVSSDHRFSIMLMAGCDAANAK